MFLSGAFSFLSCLLRLERVVQGFLVVIGCKALNVSHDPVVLAKIALVRDTDIVYQHPL